MKLIATVFTLCLAAVLAENRVKRQVDHAFPRPRLIKRQVDYAFPRPRQHAAGGVRHQASSPATDRSSPRRAIPQGFPTGFQPFSPAGFDSFGPPKAAHDVSVKEIPPPPPPRRRPPVQQRFPQESFRPVSRRRPASSPRPARPVQRLPPQRPAPQQYESPRARRPANRRPVQEVYDEEPLESEEEPQIDPLTELLAQSSFACGSKKDGYYADSSDGVNCQAFHYCSAGKKHSWMCQDGQIFHQVHLICVPGGGNGICQKSSEYEFVNDYLYKPIRKEKNITIYADRFYPENYSLGDPIGIPAERPRPQEPGYAPEEDPYRARRPVAVTRRRPEQQQYAPQSNPARRDRYQDDSIYSQDDQYQ